jgi:hypothetical protein
MIGCMSCYVHVHVHVCYGPRVHVHVCYDSRVHVHVRYGAMCICMYALPCVHAMPSVLCYVCMHVWYDVLCGYAF